MSTGTIDVVRERLEALVWQAEANDRFVSAEEWSNPEFAEALTKVKILGKFAEGFLKDLDRMEEWEYSIEVEDHVVGGWETGKWQDEVEGLAEKAAYLNRLVQEAIDRGDNCRYTYRVIKRRKPEVYQYVV